MNCRSCVHFPICEYVESLDVGFKTLRIGSDAEKCVMFNNLKTVDAVEVVRCKDCKNMIVSDKGFRFCNVWCKINGMGDDGYCNYGERR